MSKTISVERLNANNSVCSVDDYRKMVNYESGTNKGYVRFAKRARRRGSVLVPFLATVREWRDAAAQGGGQV